MHASLVHEVFLLIHTDYSMLATSNKPLPILPTFALKLMLQWQMKKMQAIPFKA